MPWVTPTSVSTGDVLQASTWNQSVVLNSLMGQPVFTNEAARAAVISSPTEGQRVYLTAPTVPAATGGSTFLPTGAQTIYTGTGWSCVTQVGAYTGDTGTTTSTSYTGTLSGTPGTNPSVTLETGSSALVTVGSALQHSALSGRVGLSFSVSGATTLAANDARAIWAVIGSGVVTTQNFTGTFIVDGLTAGTNTFTLAYRVLDAGTGTYANRRIQVQGIA